MGLPAWQSVCLQFDPRATRGHLMIGKDSKVKIKTERSVLLMEGKSIMEGLPGPHQLFHKLELVDSSKEHL
ncbi:hypothetical protein Tco_1114116 [Tanacetum coccineum]|uniref:Uncharacterized protein n=1 Tax=Tanacetum coccineum TaxID=301880 RepID=A0ABQ5IWS1_9ASTR